MKRLPLTLLFAAALIAIGACSGGGSTGSDNTVPADADVVVRAVDGIAWDHDEYTATATDGKVKIYTVNNSGLPHNLFVLDDDKSIGDFIDLPRRGDDGALVYELVPGEYRIVCKIPGHGNMNSKLVVK
jgi:plastocyanin